MVWKGSKHTQPTKDEHGFSLLELVISVGVVLVLTMVGIVSYNNLSGSSKQSATQKAADEVYGKAFSALLDSDAETKPEDVAEEYNKSSKNVVTTVDVLPAGGIKVTATLGDDYFAVRETPFSASSDGNSSIEQPTDGTIISSNTHKTIMNFQCNSNVNGFLPIINMPGNGKATLVNMSTNEETVLNNIENSTVRGFYDDRYPQTVLSSVNMEAGVPYELTVEAEVDSAASSFNPETSFAITSLKDDSSPQPDPTACLTSIDSIGNGIAGINTRYAYKLESVPSTIPSTVTSLKRAFSSASKFDDQDISSWDVSNVTDMSSMFHAAGKFNQDISSWDVSNVEYMSSMFQYANNFNQDISGWDVSDVTDMRSMFNGTYKFNQDVSSWDVSNVADMSRMFYSATAFNNGGEPLDWNEKTANVTNMSEMFFGAHAFNQDINSWNVSNVTNMSRMFIFTHVFNRDVSSWDVSNVTNMYQMFSQAKAFNQDISSWSVSNVTNMYAMFSYNTAFDNGGQPLDWNEKTANVTNMSEMFYYTEAFNQDISGWNVSNVTDMRRMFNNAHAFNQDISGWNVSNVTDMFAMFSGAKAFNQDISSWNVSNVTSMYAMFSSAEAFNQDISSWDVSNVTDMVLMFANAKAFNQDISNWKPKIAKIPTNFALNSGIGSNKQYHPQWGVA